MNNSKKTFPVTTDNIEEKMHFIAIKDTSTQRNRAQRVWKIRVVDVKQIYMLAEVKSKIKNQASSPSHYLVIFVQKQS